MSTTSVPSSTASFLVAVVLIGLGITPAPGVLRADVLTPLGNPIFDADIENPWHVAITPTKPGTHVYVASQWRGGALIALKRDANTGQLDQVQVLRHTEGVVDGLREPNGITISKDAKFVYVASAGDSTVSVFARNASSGQLSPVEMWEGADQPWNVLGCFGVALSQEPVTKSLYATGYSNGTLWVFAVNTATGKLTPKSVLRNNTGGLSGFAGPRGVAVTPEGDQVFVAAESSNTLFILNRNINTGELTLAKAWPNQTEGLTGLVGPWWIAFATLPNGGLAAYVACRGSGIVVLARSSKTKPWAVVEEHRQSPQEPGLLGCRYLVLSPDAKRLYASARESSSLSVYARDITTGRLTRVDQIGQGGPGVKHFVWPHQVIVSPDGRNAYVATGDDALHCFTLGSSGKEIAWRSVAFGGTGQYQGLRNCEKICVSPDGRNIYVPASSHENTVTCFERARSSGALTYIETLGEYGDWQPPDCLADVSQVIAPTDKDVYACSRRYNAVVHFRRNTASHGYLVFQRAYYNNGNGIVNMVRPSGMAVCPGTKKFLYVLAEQSDSIVWFEVGTDGSLVFKRSVVNGKGGVQQLDGPSNLCFSPNDSTGKSLYVTAMRSDAVVVFSRNTTTGALTYKNSKTNGVDGVHGLNGPLCIAIPHDGKHVYVVALGESVVACFTRDSSTGELKFSNTYPAFPGCGVDMTFDIAGTYLYIPFQNSNVVAAFKRDTKTGALTLVDHEESGIPPEGIDGLAGPRSLVILDNKHLYVGCADDDCIRIFTVRQ